MADAIRTEQLTKRYGRRRGLDGLDLDVRSGEVFGFLGPNGAGKTTTIRLLLALLRPTSGHARVLGTDPHMGGSRCAGASAICRVTLSWTVASPCASC